MTSSLSNLWVFRRSAMRQLRRPTIPVGSQRSGPGQPACDPQLAAQSVELTVATELAPLIGEQTVREFLAVVGQQRADPDLCRAFKKALALPAVSVALSCTNKQSGARRQTRAPGYACAACHYKAAIFFNTDNTRWAASFICFWLLTMLIRIKSE